LDRPERPGYRKHWANAVAEEPAPRAAGRPGGSPKPAIHPTLDSALASHPCVALPSSPSMRKGSAHWFHPVNIPIRPSPNSMRIFLKAVGMRSCE
jgi:hypothetical protein